MRHIKFVVLPDLRENMCCSCDIPLGDYNQVVSEFEGAFPNFDAWSHMGTPLTTSYWYLHNLQDEI